MSLKSLRIPTSVALTLGLLGAVSSVLAQEVSGTWQARVQLDAGSGEPTFVFAQEEEELSGTYQGTFGAADVTGRVEGDQVEFWFETQGTKATYTGVISGRTMKGTCDYGGVGSGTWEAEKVE